MTPERLADLRSKIDDPAFMDRAVSGLADDFLDGRVILEEPLYGGRTAEIIFHTDEGKSPKEIARLLDMTVNHVYATRKNYLSGRIESDREAKTAVSEEAIRLRQEIPNLKETDPAPDDFILEILRRGVSRNEAARIARRSRVYVSKLMKAY